MNPAIRLALAGALYLMASSCTMQGTLAQGGSPVVDHELRVFQLELGEARDAAPSPVVADALDRAERALDKFLREKTWENRATKTPENRAALGDAFRVALDAIQTVQDPRPELVLARSGLRKWLPYT